MNDELSGQLTSQWRIPNYAQKALWLIGSGAAVPVEGEYGLFELPSPASMLTLRWGGAQGPALAQLPWQPDTLEWDGSVRTGGYIDATHTTEIVGMPSMTVFFVGGQPLKPNAHPYLKMSDRSRVPYAPPTFHESIAADVPESITTWLVSEDSPMAGAAQNALLHNLRMHFWGRLAEDESWGAHFALPILLEAVTLFAP